MDLRLILSPEDPYAMAGLRAVCERADGRWSVGADNKSLVQMFFVDGPDGKVRAAGCYPLPEAVRDRQVPAFRAAHWSRLEHGPVEAFLAECLTVLDA